MEGDGPRDVWVTHSDDDGLTWAEPVDITAAVKRDTWRWYATGPGHGIQLRSGRLLVPCDHSEHGDDDHPYRSHVIYSDDRGATWQLGGTLSDRVNECTAVELTDGTVYLNMRCYLGANRRAVARSADGGQTWSEIEVDDALVEPVCQAALIDAEDCVLFSNPASVERERMTVRASFDGCRTWPKALVLHEGPSAYSDLCVAPDGGVCCLYERGDGHPYERITLARFPLASVAGE